MAEQGIAVELEPSEGTAANLQLLRHGKVALGFVQGGISVYTQADEDQLASLAACSLSRYPRAALTLVTCITPAQAVNPATNSATTLPTGLPSTSQTVPRIHPISAREKARCEAKPLATKAKTDRLADRSAPVPLRGKCKR